MTKATNTTKVLVNDTVEIKQVKKTKKLAPFLSTEWWETISTKILGSDIHVVTDKKIESVFVNDIEYKPVDNSIDK